MYFTCNWVDLSWVEYINKCVKFNLQVVSLKSRRLIQETSEEKLFH